MPRVTFDERSRSRTPRAIPKPKLFYTKLPLQAIASSSVEMPAPPKPWELSGGGVGASNSSSAHTSGASEAAPAVPERPSSLTASTDATLTGT